MDHAPGALFAINHDSTIRLVNREAERLTGYSRAQLIGKSVEILVPEYQRDRLASIRERFDHDPHEGSLGLDGAMLMRHADGREVPVELSASAILIDGATFIVALRDITARRNAEQALQFSVEQLALERQAQDDLETYQHILERIARGEPREQTLVVLCREVERRFPGAMCTVMIPTADRTGLSVAAAPTMPKVVSAALEGLPIAYGMGACGTAAFTREMVVVEDTLTDPLTQPFLALARDQNLRAVWSNPLFDGDDNLLGTFALYRSIPHRPDAGEVMAISAAAGLAALAIERSESERALTQAAECDSLTGLPNRASFLSKLRNELEGDNSQIAVMFLDLDRFKWINDSLGHPSGDRILRDVADRLTDALEPGQFLARFGGDEFTVLVSDATAEKARLAAERFDAAIVAPFMLDGGEFFLSVSIGIALNDHETDAVGLVSDADAAMYAAKERGRARHVMFDARMRARAMQRVTRENDMRRAIERDELVMHYQPVVRVSDGSWTTIEALVRWHHPTNGLMMPDDFVPLAEETGLIVPLGLKVLDLAVRDAGRVIEGHPDLRFAINVSALQLADPAVGAEVGKALARHRVQPHQIILEVTETGLMEQIDVVRTALDRVVAMGVGVVIDDFGTGYSSIARLGELPIDGVKIDHSFAQGLGTDPHTNDVMAAITSLAHAFHLGVVAEGIEDSAAYERVKQLDCDGAQGYFLARPMPLENLIAQLDERDA